MEKVLALFFRDQDLSSNGRFLGITIQVYGNLKIYCLPIIIDLENGTEEVFDPMIRKSHREYKMTVTDNGDAFIYFYNDDEIYFLQDGKSKLLEFDIDYELDHVSSDIKELDEFYLITSISFSPNSNPLEFDTDTYQEIILTYLSKDKGEIVNTEIIEITNASFNYVSTDYQSVKSFYEGRILCTKINNGKLEGIIYLRSIDKVLLSLMRKGVERDLIVMFLDVKGNKVRVHKKGYNPFLGVEASDKTLWKIDYNCLCDKKDGIYLSPYKNNLGYLFQFDGKEISREKFKSPKNEELNYSIHSFFYYSEKTNYYYALKGRLLSFKSQAIRYKLQTP